MENKRPLILVSNDDGIMAKGINELVKFLRPLGDIVVMAPDAPRSGSGCALTVTQPVHYQLVKKEVGLTVYKCSGTPTDCIKLARNTVLDRTPDLVVGGINHGDNSATNVHYSGTMGVVFEGCLNGIPSIGFSLCNHAPDADFEAAEAGSGNCKAGSCRNIECVFSVTSGSYDINRSEITQIDRNTHFQQCVTETA